MKKILTFLLVLCMMISGTALLAGCVSSEGKVIEVSSAEEIITALKSEDENLTIKLTQDIDFDSQIVVSRKVTLDMNGKKISNSKEIWNNAEGVKAWSLISVQGNGDLVIKGNGTFDSLENDCYALDLRDGAKCLIEDGTYIGNISAVYVFLGELTINDGRFSIRQLSDNKDYRFMLNCYDKNYKDGLAKITVKGGVYDGFNPADCLAEGEGTSFVAEGYNVVADKTDIDLYSVVKK